MSTYTSEPGTRVAGRYRLVDQVHEGAGWTYWKATDETLARSVAVLTFAPGFPRVTTAVTAARAASRLNDPRFPQVFDVEDAEEPPYVVMEWVVGESLLDMLSEGPLDPPSATALLLEAAQAVTAAHAAGLTHLRLNPACLHWTPGGGVKIAGLGIDAALDGLGPAGSRLSDPDLAAPDLSDPDLAGETDAESGEGDPEHEGSGDEDPEHEGPGDEAEDPALIDTRDLARLLYAALTGYWPGVHGSLGSEPGLLPPAPEADGTWCTPRQVSAAVPANVDAVICRALFQRPTRHGPALSTPAMFADALAGVAPPIPIPPAATSASRTTAGSNHYSDRSTNSYQTAAETAAQPRTVNGSRRPPARKRSTAIRAIAAAAVVLIVAAIGIVVWSLNRSPAHTTVTPPARAHSSSPAAAAIVQLKPVNASSFDPFGDSGSEDAAGTQYAIDGNSSTAWHTSYYIGYSAFGHIKSGTGLLLDMGKQVQLSQVTVQFGQCCTHAEIEIGNQPTVSAEGLKTFTELQSSTTAQGVTTFSVTKKTTGRYVLIWITDLPPLLGSAGHYEAFIYDVSLRGSTVSQSG
jgi:serine/threonine protein kinase